MKLWDKGTSVNKEIETFTVGQDRLLDLKLADWDVLGSLAHIKMLESIDLLSGKEYRELQNALQRIFHDNIRRGNFTIDEGVEDVHSQIELLLTESIGESGKKIHSGRSRNDQVLLDLKLFFRNEIQEITLLVEAVFRSLIFLSEKYKGALMPGYTHMQVAMPSSFGLWFGAYAECLADDLIQMKASYDICNQNPLGSAAGYGSSFPLDRTMTTKLLGFDSPAYNVIYAQMGRGRTEKSIAVSMASVASTLGKLASDICLYNGQDFNFIKLPDEFTTGSSIMPHKKNPDVFEILRGKCNKILALPNSIALGLANLQTGYHRDLQLLKEDIFPLIEDLKSCLKITATALSEIKVNEELINDKKYDYLFTVEEVNKRVYAGVPFREAYKQVGKLIEEGKFKPVRKVEHTHEGSIGNLCNEQITGKFEKILHSFHFEKAESAIEKLLAGKDQ